MNEYRNHGLYLFQEEDRKLIITSEIAGKKLAKLVAYIETNFQVKSATANMTAGVMIDEVINQMTEDKELQNHVEEIIEIVSE